MNQHPDIEALERLAKGEGDGETAAHAGSCAECAREVAWAKAERALFARRAQPDVARLWTGVEERLAKEAAQPVLRRPHWHRRASALAGAVAAAAALFIVMRYKTRPPVAVPAAQAPQQVATAQQPAPQARRPHFDPKTLAALDTAEADYRHAATVLEAEYDSLRPRLDPKLAKKWDETLTRARTQLGESRAAVAAEDVRARMRVLDGYADYLRSLRDVIQGSEEATP